MPRLPESWPRTPSPHPDLFTFMQVCRDSRLPSASPLTAEAGLDGNCKDVTPGLGVVPRGARWTPFPRCASSRAALLRVRGGGDAGQATSVTPGRRGLPGHKADPAPALELFLAGPMLTEPRCLPSPGHGGFRAGWAGQEGRVCVPTGALVGSTCEEGFVFIGHLLCPCSQDQGLISSHSL